MKFKKIGYMVCYDNGRSLDPMELYRPKNTPDKYILGIFGLTKNKYATVFGTRKEAVNAIKRTNRWNAWYFHNAEKLHCKIIAVDMPEKVNP